MSDISEEYHIKVLDDDSVTASEKENDQQQDPAGSEQLIERLKRLQAEFANYKKRVQKETLELSSYVKSQLIYNLLPVIDDMKRLSEHKNMADRELLEVANTTYQKLFSILEKEGLQEIESIGKEFDPTIHEAVLIETGEGGRDNLILDEWEKGYKFKSRLLRPAKVKVYQVEN